MVKINFKMKKQTVYIYICMYVNVKKKKGKRC